LNCVKTDDLIFFGGEEYETIATIPKQDFKKLMKDARKYRIKVYHIGKVVRGNGNLIYELNGIRKTVRNKGFVHFAK
jgi:thiamine-monophosphate kinase